MTSKTPENIDLFVKKAEAIKKTAYIRFDCAERLASQEKLRLFVSTVLAIFLVTWSISQLAFPDCIADAQEGFLNFLSIISSISLLALGLVDYSSNRGLHSHIMLQNAQHLLRLGERLERLARSPEASHGEMNELCELYHDSLASAGINHHSADNKLATIAKRNWGRLQFLNSFVFWATKHYHAFLDSLLPVCVLAVVSVGWIWAATTGANFNMCFN